MEFWNSEITEESWVKLNELRREFNFVLIGGWAIYVYTKLHKSKDIDMIVDYDTLRILSGRYRLQKNERLRKYEIKLDRFDIDVYLPSYSRLTIPHSDILDRFKDRSEGFTLPNREVLLALKLGAFVDRKGSMKGDKDMIDIICMLFYSGINLKKFIDLTEEYNLTEYPEVLLRILEGDNKHLLSYLNLNEKSFAEKRKKHVREIKSII